MGVTRLRVLRRLTGRFVAGVAPLLPALTVGFAIACAVAWPGAAVAQAIALHGRVEDEAKKPIAGATVRLHPLVGGHRAAELHLAGTYPPPAVAEAKSVADGTFRVEAPQAGQWRVVVVAEGKAERQCALRMLVEETWLEPVVLPAAAPLEVRVVGPDGKPVAGAVVATQFVDGQSSRPGTWSTPRALLLTDATGRAVVPRAPKDRLDVHAAAAGFAVAEAKAVRGSTLTLALRRGLRRAVVANAPNGSPAAGVLVTTEAHGLPLGRTGPGGRLVLGLHAGEPLLLSLEDAGGAAARLTLEPPVVGAEPAPQQVRLLPPRRLAGRVIDSEARQPVPGALVSSGVEGESVVTDARGGFVLQRPGTLAARAVVHAAAAGHFPANVQLPQSATTVPTLALDRAAAVIGSVTEASGHALAGVEVTAVARPGAMGSARPRFDVAAPRATTDARGRFRLDRVDPRLRLEVTFRHRGFAPLRKEVSARPGSPTQLDVVLSAGALTSGVVVDPDEQPIGGATVKLTRQEAPGVMTFSMGGPGPRADAEGSSDATGRFTLVDLAPGRYELVASASGFATTTLPGVVVPEGQGTADLGKVEMEPGVSVSGHVVDGSGVPVAGADVYALTGRWTSMPTMRFLSSELEPATATAADGSFTIADRRPGERLDVGVQRSGYTAGRAAGVVAPTEEPLVIALTAASDLRGRVLDPRREPIADARVVVSIERAGGGMMFFGAGGNTTTGSDGRFVVEDVEPGMVRLTVSAEGFLDLERGAVEVQVGKDLEGVELVLQPGAVVEGAVTTPDGQPAVGAWVRVVVEGQPGGGGGGRMGMGGTATTDGDGRYRVTGVEPGRRTLDAWLEGHDRAVGELEVAAGDNRLDLQLGAGQEVSGRVAGPQGEPIAGATVRLAAAGTSRWSRHSATTDEAGAFTIKAVPEGSYEAIASHRDYADGKSPVSVAGGPAGGVLIELTAGGSVVGALRGLAASELAGIRVSARSDQSWRQGEVGRDGRYRVAGLTPGSWSVSAQSDAGGRQASGNVELAPSQGEVELDLDFAGGFAVHGVIRHQGQPVDGARLMLAGTDVSAYGNTQSDHQGRYRVENVKPGTYRLEVADLQRGLRHRTEVVVEGDRELDVELRSARIAGRVLEATSDDPVTGASIELRPLDEKEDPYRFSVTRAESDDRGTFVVGAVGEGRWKLVALKAGYAPAETVVELTGQPVEGLELRLQPTQGVTLRVARTTGSYPDGVSAVVLDGAGRAVTGGYYPTGEGGAVRLLTVPPGAWEVLVRAEGLAIVRVAVQSPGPPVAVLLAPQALLEVMVPELTASDAIATVTLQGADGAMFRFIWGNDVRTDLQMHRGRSSLQALPAGQWQVVVTAPDGRRWSGTAVTAAGATATVELR